MAPRTRAAVAILAAALFFGATVTATAATPTIGLEPDLVAEGVDAPWRVGEFEIRTLEGHQRLYGSAPRLTKRWPPTSLHDRHGVPMRLIGGRPVYHPVGLTLLGLKYMANYWRSGDRMYLTLATRVGRGLERIGVERRGGIWFPYRFQFAMHGNARETLAAPWYSGMAQGLALALFVRIWRETGSDEFRSLADRTYASLAALGRGSQPWVTWVDPEGYLWIEEYPGSLDYTLNGKMYATFGLYEYALATQDRTVWSAERHAGAVRLLKGSLTTLKTFASKYRNPGGPSAYCLKHRRPSLKYHRTHIWQLRRLHQITGDAEFLRVMEAFTADAR